MKGVVRMSKIKKTLKIIRTIWIAVGVLFLIYLPISFQAHGVDSTLLKGDEQIVVSNLSDKIEFVPQSGMKASALIFYPGGMVDPKAYVPMARKLAENGHKVVILKLPFRSAASLSQKRELFLKTIELVSGDNENLAWVLSGHSKGGALAAECVWNNEGVFDELVLIATTHPKNYSLADRNVQVTKIYASNDGVASEAKIFENLDKLPRDTTLVKIEGGNHGQFGYYGFQIGDSRATISRDEQNQQLVASLLQVLNKTNKTKAEL
jgi:pimeloyl-ACP methyl ester carboxylesterase